MKKFLCFLVAFTASISMYFITGFFVRLTDEMMEPMLPSLNSLIVLQVICAVKFAILVLLLMPGKPQLAQTGLGFISADALLLISGAGTGGPPGLPYAMIGVQALMLLAYMVLQGRTLLYKNNILLKATRNELITSPI